MGKIIARRCEGQDLATVAKLSDTFEADGKRLTSGVGNDDALATAAMYATGFPQLVELIGHDWRAEPERTSAYYALSIAHERAVTLLMAEAERRGLDSAPLWEFGRICRELFADEPWKYYVGSYDTWPDCLGHARATLPDDYRRAIQDGEGLLRRLDIRVSGSPALSDDAKLAATRDAEATIDELRAELNELSDLQRNIIEALDELHAYDRATRRTTGEIATKANGSAKVNPLRKPMADLTMRQVTESVGGREGGVWLSAKGRRAAEIVRGEDGSTGEAPAS